MSVFGKIGCALGTVSILFQIMVLYPWHEEISKNIKDQTDELKKRGLLMEPQSANGITPSMTQAIEASLKKDGL
ncbi:hypothetical protein B484DRAFT_454758 [Ochromonadaceae sp. CCMP2298]|nr:hypothetical protein B484DRAFT_454758 [Ochromonadaceae sp. CCMP2298]|eukprot:CAMPEP_0173168236 /NCGR_PEP_ID=MMETSP1141-20130122/28_1 /TAXON_ID=483371 /ORGANISM="non described non described, Strain CCMP2298" /LENGTH=73 /DNA_ID=CAMNT_0014089913 /DNA_START=63 /DNA_END=284 /DNA_ORIENTATION=-